MRLQQHCQLVWGQRFIHNAILLQQAVTSPSQEHSGDVVWCVLLDACRTCQAYSLPWGCVRLGCVRQQAANVCSGDGCCRRNPLPHTACAADGGLANAKQQQHQPPGGPGSAACSCSWRGYAPTPHQPGWQAEG